MLFGIFSGFFSTHIFVISCSARVKRGTALKAVVTDWLKSYEEKAAESTLELVNLVIQV